MLTVGNGSLRTAGGSPRTRKSRRTGYWHCVSGSPRAPSANDEPRSLRVACQHGVFWLE